MSNSNKDIIINRIKNPVKYAPRFKVGDVIMNNKFKTVAQILELDKVEYGMAPNPVEVIYRYRVVYIVNPLSKSPKKQSWRESIKIDAYYDIVCPKVAQILYGNLVEVKNDQA